MHVDVLRRDPSVSSLSLAWITGFRLAFATHSNSTKKLSAASNAKLNSYLHQPCFSHQKFLCLLLDHTRSARDGSGTGRFSREGLNVSHVLQHVLHCIETAWLCVSNLFFAVAESENGDLRYSALCWLSLCVCRWIRTRSLYITSSFSSI